MDRHVILVFKLFINLEFSYKLISLFIHIAVIIDDDISPAFFTAWAVYWIEDYGRVRLNFVYKDVGS